VAYPPDESIFDRLRQHTWKWAPRWHTPRLIIIHSTRSGIPGHMAQEYGSTLNWQMSPSNRVVEADGSVWGSMSDRVIGHDGRLCRSLPDDCHPTWSAGHMDPWAISYELAQPTNDTPFTEATLDRAAREIAKDCGRYNIPPVVLPYVSGDNHEAPGIARHDHSANGRTWGKSDPGVLFDDQAFERRVRAYMPTCTPEQLLALIRALTPALLAGDLATLYRQIVYLYALAHQPLPV